MSERCTIVLGPGTEGYTIKEIRYRVGSERGKNGIGSDTFVSSVEAAAVSHMGVESVKETREGKTVILEEGEPSHPDSLFNTCMVTSLMRALRR